MTRFSLATLAMALFAALPLRAEDVTTFGLDNGMEVVVIEDHRAPVVVNMVWYKVGSADEPRGHSGIAHFLEHLMFKATETMAPGAFSDTVEQNGGSDNAFTSLDYTGYFQRVASDRLGLMMRMEADRMVNLVLTDDVVLPERDVILEERNQRVENNPGALFSEQRMAAQYLNHPYGTPIIGWKHEVSQLTREDALSFYRRYYAPNNAILIVAGDVTPDQVRTLAEQNFGPIPANPDLPPRVRAQEPPQTSARHLVYEDPRTTQPYVLRTYLATERNPGDQKGAAALVYLEELLGGSGATSVMGRKLEFEDKTALYTSAFYDGVSVDKTVFGLVVMPVPGRSLQQAEADMDAVIADFLMQGVDPEQFARIKTQIKASEIYARDRLQGLARRYGEALTSGLSVQDVQDWPAILQSVTPEDVMAAATRLFDKQSSVTGYLTHPTIPEASQ